MKKILVLLFLFLYIIIISAEPKNFIYVDEAKLSVIQEVYPELGINNIAAMCFVKLDNISPNAIIRSKLTRQTYGVDSIANKIIYSIGDEDIETYGDGDGEERFNNPQGIDCHNDGSVFVVDTGNNRVVKLHCDGESMTYIGKSVSGFNQPLGIYVSKKFEGINIPVDEKKVYIADTGNNRILKYDLDLNPVNDFSSLNILEHEKIIQPVDVIADTEGNIFVCNKNGSILKFNNNGYFKKEIIITNIADIGVKKSELTAVALDKFNGIYVADSFNLYVYKFDNELNFLAKMGGFGSGDYNFFSINDLSIYGKYGGIAVIGRDGGKIYRQGPGLQITKMSNQTFSPYNRQKDKFKADYKIISHCLINALILDNDDKLIRVLADNKYKNCGIHELVWDGRNDMGEYVAETNYNLQIIANVAVQKPQMTDFDPEIYNQEVYDKFFSGGFGQEIQEAVSIVHPVIVKVESVFPKVLTASVNEVIVRYSVPKDGEVFIKIESLGFNVGEGVIETNYSDVKELQDWTGKDRGTHYISWDGKDDDNEDAVDGVYAVSFKARNSDSESDWVRAIVGVDRESMQITNLQMPEVFSPRKEDLVVRFEVSEKCYLSATVYGWDKYKTESYAVRVIMDKEMKDKGEQEIRWDGKDNTGRLAPEGEYYIEIIAEDMTGNSKAVKTTAKIK